MGLLTALVKFVGELNLWGYTIVNDVTARDLQKHMRNGCVAKDSTRLR